MTTLAQLQAEANEINTRLRAITQRIRETSSGRLPDNQLLEERQQLRNQLQEVNRQIERIEVSAARSFTVSVDENTGLVVIRTSDGLIAGRGNTLADAKEAAIRFNGADPAALANLQDPTATPPAPPVSTGQTVTEAQQANDEAASTQAPEVPAEQADAGGNVETTSPTTVPSNAATGVAETPVVLASPEKLPPGSVPPGPETTGSQSPLPAQQRGGVNVDSPDENTNQISYIYRAYQVTSHFRQGKFTQEIEGAQIFFPLTAQSAAPPQVRESTTDSITGQSGSVAQGTVAQTAATPGATSLAGFRRPDTPVSLPGVGIESNTVPPLQTKVFEFQEFDNPVIDQVSTIAPLTSTPASVPTAADIAQSAANAAALQQQINQARNNKTQAERALATVEARIARGEGNILENQTMKTLYSNQITRANQAITQLEQQAQQGPALSSPSTNVAPQQGAKEY